MVLDLKKLNNIIKLFLCLFNERRQKKLFFHLFSKLKNSSNNLYYIKIVKIYEFILLEEKKSIKTNFEEYLISPNALQKIQSIKNL